ncbi:pyridoxamine 5'-phosphate oxidase family protein [Ectobacillus polymachus]|uniref:pyridoxamine 5'-phosphate oxidase family protein n=1 Tax=Ectobacillus polymachus TaxID=1508806 RepID=UPI003A855251
MNDPIRQKKLEVTNQAKINQFLSEAKTGYLGLTNKETPYVVPLNYIWWKDAIYFHGAAEGRKTEMIKDNANACFTVSEENGTLVNPIPAHTDTVYMSVILFGLVEIVTSLEEATASLQQLLNKYVPGYYNSPLAQSHVEKYQSSLGSKTAVYKIVPTHISAKENKGIESSKFYPGRTIQDDL